MISGSPDAQAYFFNDIKAKLERGVSQRISVRELLVRTGFKRRRDGVVEKIVATLSKYGLTTNPDFSSVYIDSEVGFELVRSSSHRERLDEVFAQVRVLRSAECDVKFVKESESIKKALTIMEVSDYSQLPVYNGHNKMVGYLSRLCILRKIASIKGTTICSDVMNREYQDTLVDPRLGLIECAKIVIEKGFVFGVGLEQTVSGFVTVQDIVEKFSEISEPLILVSEIERSLRVFCSSKLDFSVATKNASVKMGSEQRDFSDLTFGQLKRIIENPENWSAFQLGFLDRVEFGHSLEVIRLARNDLMHFNPDGLDEDQISQLRAIAKLSKNRFI